MMVKLSVHVLGVCLQKDAIVVRAPSNSRNVCFMIIHNLKLI